MSLSVHAPDLVFYRRIRRNSICTSYSASGGLRGHRLQCRRGRLAAALSLQKANSSADGEFDVGSVVINPVYRSTPWLAESNEAMQERKQVRLLFVSESNVCRSVLAEAMMSALLAGSGLQDAVVCESKGTRDYNLGQGPESSVVQAAAELGLQLPDGATAQLFDSERDIVMYDLVLVMDKYTAADVLREVSSYDLIHKGAGYSLKVRRLGEFHPQLAKRKEPDSQDIDDPLYGNYGGEDEKEAVKHVAMLIQDSCQGLLQYLQGLHAQAGNQTFVTLLHDDIRRMEKTPWLVPPMLTGRTAPRQAML